MPWTDEATVAAHLGIDAADTRLPDVVAAALAWCARQRPDLDPAEEPGGDVTYATTLYAALLFRRRTAPQGLPAYDESGVYDAGESMTEIYRLLGNRKPVAR